MFRLITFSGSKYLAGVEQIIAQWPPHFGPLDDAYLVWSILDFFKAKLQTGAYDVL
jgi:hypothetical protein